MMKALGYRFVFSMVVGISLTVLTGCTRIKPDEIGVLTKNFGKGEGIMQEDYKPGFHRYLWPLDTWHRFPSTVQRIRFAKDSTGPWGQEGGALQLTSADGDRVIMTAEVLFRIADEKAHWVLQDSGTDERYVGVVRGLAQDASRALFGQLKTEDFYNEARRQEARQQAVDHLKNRLALRGIELLDFLVQGVEFDSHYEDLIKKKKVADQRVELEKAKGRAAVEQGRVNKIQVESKAKVQKINQEAEAVLTQLGSETKLQVASINTEASVHVNQRNADASLYESQKRAEGDKLIKQAEADGTRRLNAALTGEGGRNLVALEAAKGLNLTDVSFPSQGADWFNPYSMALRLGATDRLEGAPAAPIAGPAVKSKR